MPVLNVGTVGQELNLLVRQGADFVLDFELTNPDTTPVNLTGIQGITSQVRKTPSNPVVVQSFTVVIPTPSNGKFSAALTAAQTGAIKANDDPKSSENNYVWDMELHDSLGAVTPLFYGTFKMFRQVTRD